MQQQPIFTDERDQQTPASAHHDERPGGAPHPLDLAAAPYGFSTPPGGQGRPGRTRYLLIALAFLLLAAASAALLPVLFAQPARLTATAPPLATATVGSISFESSGQLNATSSQGLNDVVSIDLHDIPPPAAGKSDFAWLLPDKSQDELQPVQLGVLQVHAGKALLT